MIFLYLESFENKRFELHFSIFQKPCILQSNPLRKVIFLHGYDIFFSRFLLLSMYKKNFRKYRTILSKKIRHKSTTLRCSRRISSLPFDKRPAEANNWRTVVNIIFITVGDICKRCSDDQS